MSLTSPSLAHPGLLGRILARLRERYQAIGELDDLTGAELRALADDLALSEQDLVDLAANSSDNTVLMERMMRARGLDEAQLRQSFATLVRDIERVCAGCRATGRCRRELDAGTAAAHADAYCPNASTFDDLADATTPY